MKKEIIARIATLCNLCGKELEGSEANDIIVMVGGSEYYNFNLCEKHWVELYKRLEEIQSSTGRTNNE